MTSDLEQGSPRQLGSVLASATFAAMVAVAVIFIVRAVGTFWIPRSATVALLTSSARLLANLVVIVFLIAFRRGFPDRRGSNLKGATTVLLVAYAVRAVVILFDVLRVFGVAVVAPETAAAIGTVVSLLLAFAALMFFTSLCSQVEDEGSAFARAVRFAVAGALVSTVAQAAAFALFATRLMHPELVPLSSPLLRVLAILLSGFVFATLIGFLAALRGKLRREGAAPGC